jgi:hypothetical protein
MVKSKPPLVRPIRHTKSLCVMHRLFAEQFYMRAGTGIVVLG